MAMNIQLPVSLKQKIIDKRKPYILFFYLLFFSSKIALSQTFYENRYFLKVYYVIGCSPGNGYVNVYYGLTSNYKTINGLYPSGDINNAIPTNAYFDAGTYGSTNLKIEKFEASVDCPSGGTSMNPFYYTKGTFISLGYVPLACCSGKSATFKCEVDDPIYLEGITYSGNIVDNNIFSISKYYNNGNNPILQFGYDNSGQWSWKNLPGVYFNSSGGNISINLFDTLRKNLENIYSKDFYFRVVKTLGDGNATKTFGNIIGPFRFYDNPRIKISGPSVVCEDQTVSFTGEYDHFSGANVNPEASVEVKLPSEDDTKWRVIPGYVLTNEAKSLSYTDIAGSNNWLGKEIQVRPFKMFNGTKKVVGDSIKVVFLPRVKNINITPYPPSCSGGDDGSFTLEFTDIPANGCKNPDGSNINLVITIEQYTEYKLTDDINYKSIIYNNKPYYYYNGATMVDNFNLTGNNKISINNSFLKTYATESRFRLESGLYKIIAFPNGAQALCGPADTIVKEFKAPAPFKISIVPELIYDNTKKYHVITGGNSAKCKINLKGGTPPYEILDGSISGIPLAAFNTSGEYIFDVPTELKDTTIKNLYIKDKFNCAVSGTFPIIFVRPPDIAFDNGLPKNTDCNVNDNGSHANGEVSWTIKGGVTPYKVDLYHQGTSGVIETQTNIAENAPVIFNGANITKGDYYIKVSDALNTALDKQSGTLNVNEPTEISISATPSHNKCYGDLNGSFDITPVGGNGNFSLPVIKNTSLEEKPNGSLAAGLYSITIQDSKNCSKTITGQEIEQPAEPLKMDAFYSKPASCIKISNAEVTTVLTGIQSTNPSTDINFTYHGEPLHSKEFTGSAGKFTFVLNNLAQTESMEIVVADLYCTTSDTVRIPLRNPQLTLPEPVTTTPAPCTGKYGIVSLSPVNAEGSCRFFIDGLEVSSATNHLKGNSVHSFKITDGAGCSDSTNAYRVLVTIDSIRMAEIAEADITAAWCSKSATGSIKVNTVPGTGIGNKTYNITGLTHPAFDADLSSFTGLLPKQYTITATDDSLCSSSKTTVVPVRSDSLYITAINSKNAACKESSPTGELKVSRYTNSGIKTGFGDIIYTLEGLTNTDTVFNNLYSGSYTITASDDKNCEVSVIAEVGFNNNPVSLTIDSVFDQTCNEVKNARIYLKAHTVTTGTPQDFKFSFNNNTTDWNNDTVSYKLNVAGTYDFMVTDRDNCGTSLSHTIFNLKHAPKPMLDNLHPVACKNATNGGITVYSIPNNSLAKYNYNLGENLKYALQASDRVTFDNLARGYYTITAMDTLGCTDTTRFLVTVEPDSVHIKSINTQVASCIAAQNGKAGIVASSADHSVVTDKYLFSVNGSILKGDSVTFTNLAVNKTGNYTVQVSDRFGCKNNANFVIGVQPDTINLFSRSYVNPSCPDYNDGSITFRKTNGNETFRYEVSSAGYNQVFYHTDTLIKATGLAEGIYTISVKDTANCHASITGIKLTQPKDIAFISTNFNYIKHKGEPEGILQARVWRGNSKYRFEWLNIADNSTIKNGTATDTSIIKLTGLYAGNYKLRVRDTANCFAGSSGWLEKDFAMIEPEKELSLSVTQLRDVSCFGLNDGEFTLQATGGWGDQYRYGFDAINLFADNHFTGRLKESIVMFAADTSGVIASIPVNINQPDALTASLDSKSDVTCFGTNNGSATLKITGGNYPFYSVSTDNQNWEKGYTKHNLPIGNYTIHVKDTLGCTAQADVSIIQPPQIVRKNYQVAETRCGYNNGSINANFDGGIAPYKYQWYEGGNLLSSSTNTIGSLYSGTYNLNVTDAADCSRSFSFNISDITDLTIDTIIPTPVTCWGYSDGKAVIQLSKGNPPYTITWPGNIQGNAVSGLPEGVYSVGVTDIEKCKVFRDFEIKSPVQVYLGQQTISQPLCEGVNDGAISVEAVSDFPGFSYNWSNGKSGNTMKNLLPGNYTVTVTDNHNCNNTFNFDLQYQHFLKPSLGNDLTLCSGNSTFLTPGDYSSYNWQSANGFKSHEPLITISQPGDYAVEVTDESGCIGRDTIHIAQSATEMTGKLLVATYINQNDTVMIFEASWPLPDSVKFELEGCKVLSAGKYYREVVFADTGTYKLSLQSYLNDCMDYVEKAVVVETATKSGKKSMASRMVKSFKASPNPNNGMFNVEIILRETSPVFLRLANISTGIITDVREYKGSDIYTLNYNMNLPAGMYLLHLQAGNETQTKTLIIQ